MRLRHVVLILVLLGGLSAAVFGLVRHVAVKQRPGPYASAPVIRAPAQSDRPAGKHAPVEKHAPVRVPPVVAKAPAPGALSAVPRRSDLVLDLAAVLVAAYQPADPCAESAAENGRSGVLRISARELVRRYAPALAKTPETRLRLSVTPPMLEIGFLFVSGRFAGAIRSQTREAERYCPATGHTRRLSARETDEALVLIAAWLRGLAACSRNSQSSQDCAYARRLTWNLLQGERTRDRVISTAAKLLDNLAAKIDQDIEKTGG